MGRFIAFLYGLASYVVFFVTFLYAIGFVSGLVVPKTIDTGTVVPMAEAFIVNLLLMSVFAIQHSVMARQPFAAVTTAYILVGILLEERDLVDLFGDDYRRYKDRVSMLVSWRRSA